MRQNPRGQRGVTLIELAVVIALIGIVAVIAGSYFERRMPRAGLANTTAELQALLYNARQKAMADGHDVAVLIFPDFANPRSGVGRLVVYEDAVGDFFTGGANGGVKFTSYQANALKAGSFGGASSRVWDTLDLPRGVVVGTSTTYASGTLPAPYTGIQVSSCCPFCSTGSSRRGAIRFSARGQVSFYDGSSYVPLVVSSGSSLTLQAQNMPAPDVIGQRTLVIFAPSGTVWAAGN